MDEVEVDQFTFTLKSNENVAVTMCMIKGTTDEPYMFKSVETVEKGLFRFALLLNIRTRVPFFFLHVFARM